MKQFWQNYLIFQISGTFLYDTILIIEIKLSAKLILIILKRMKNTLQKYVLEELLKLIM